MALSDMSLGLSRPYISPQLIPAAGLNTDGRPSVSAELLRAIKHTLLLAARRGDRQPPVPAKVLTDGLWRRWPLAACALNGQSRTFEVLERTASSLQRYAEERSQPMVYGRGVR